MGKFRKIVKNFLNFFSRKITVCGDTHGQYFDLNNIFKLNGKPSAENPYLFNGDFVDRGSWGLEVFITLLGWKLHDPKCMYLTRGNHETRSMNELYGFEGEVRHKGKGIIGCELLAHRLWKWYFKKTSDFDEGKSDLLLVLLNDFSNFQAWKHFFILRFWRKVVLDSPKIEKMIITLKLRKSIQKDSENVGFIFHREHFHDPGHNLLG